MTTHDDLKLTLRLVKIALGGGIVAIFAAGALWATTKDTLELVPAVVEAVNHLKAERDDDRQIMRDFMLLACAKDGLNQTERRICARYEPRMPR